MTILSLPNPNTPILDYRRLRENDGLWKDNFDPRTLAPSQEWYAALQKISIAAASLPFYNGLDWELKGEDIDYTENAQDAVDEVYDNGGGVIWVPPGIFRISDEVNFRSGVWFKCAGMGTEYIRGSTVSNWGPFKYGTQFHWYGTQANTAQMFNFEDKTAAHFATSMGITDCYIDMRAATGACATGSGTGCPTSSAPTAIRTHATWGTFFERISINHAGLAFKHINEPGASINLGIRICGHMIDVHNSWKGIELTGDHGVHPDGVAVANSEWSKLYFQNIVDCPFDVVQHSDNVNVHQSQFDVIGAGGAACRINGANESPATNQIGNIVLRDVLLTASKLATKSLVIGDTTGIVYWTGGMTGDPPEGAGVDKAVLVPIGQVLDVTERLIAYNDSPNGSTGYGAATDQTRLFIDFRDFIPFYAGQAGWLASAIRKIEWVTRWEPQTSAGGIRLRDMTAGGAGIIVSTFSPGASGFRNDKIDITAYVRAASAMRTAEAHFQLQTKGDGATSPYISKSWLLLHIPRG